MPGPSAPKAPSTVLGWPWDPAAYRPGPASLSPHPPNERWLFSVAATDAAGNLLEPLQPSRLPEPGEPVLYELPLHDSEFRPWDPHKAATEGWHWEIWFSTEGSYWARVPDPATRQALEAENDRATAAWLIEAAELEKRQALLDFIKPGAEASALVLRSPSGRTASLGALGFSSTLGVAGPKLVLSGQVAGGLDTRAKVLGAVAADVTLQLPVVEYPDATGRGDAVGFEIGAQAMLLSQHGVSPAIYGLPHAGVYYKQDEIVVSLGAGSTEPLRPGIADGAEKPLPGTDRRHPMGFVKLTLPLTSADTAWRNR